MSLPTPTGPHPVGTATFYWVDRSRQEVATADPDDLRQVVAQVWYPAEASAAATTPYFPRLDDALLALRTRTDDLSKVIESQSRQRDVRTQSIEDAKVATPRGGARYPVVVVSPGGNVSRHSHTALAQELASRGYVVAVISHAYNGWDVFPAGGFLKSIDWGINANDPERARTSEDSLADTLAADTTYALDRLAELERFAGRLDLQHAAIVGHSRGGITVARGCSEEPRFLACVTLDNVGPDREVKQGLEKPQMTIRTASWAPARVERLHGFLSRNTAGAIEVTIAGAAHMSFTDLPLIDRTQFKSEIDPERVHRIFSALIASFLDEHLRGLRTSVEATAAQFKEVTLKRFSR